MRKRDKVRIPQEAQPWIRVRQWNDNKVMLIGKKTTRQFAGTRRNQQARVLTNQLQIEASKLMIRSFMTSPQSLSSEQQVNLRRKYQRLGRWSVKGRSKNFCLILGKARTYNRRLFLSRQAFRELVSFGLISGISN